MVTLERALSRRALEAENQRLRAELLEGELLGEAPVMAVSRVSADAFVRRGGRIPAPVRSLTN